MVFSVVLLIRFLIFVSFLLEKFGKFTGFYIFFCSTIVHCHNYSVNLRIWIVGLRSFQNCTLLEKFSKFTGFYILSVFKSLIVRLRCIIPC